MSDKKDSTEKSLIEQAAEKDAAAAEKKAKEDEPDPFKDTFDEFTRALDRIDKSLAGDVTAFSSAERSLNRFRKRFDRLMWAKIIYWLTPKTFHEQIIRILSEANLFSDETVLELMAKESGLSVEDCTELLNQPDFRAKPTDVMQDVLKLRGVRLQREKEEAERLAREKAEADGDVEMADATEEKDKPAAEANTEKKEVEKEENQNEKKKRVRIRRWQLESSFYIRLLAIYEIYDCGQVERTLELIGAMIDELHAVNRRSLDVLSPRMYLLFTLCAKRLNRPVRKLLYDWYERAVLTHNSPGSLALTDAILGWYLDRNMYSTAHKFATKSELDEHANGNSALLARYHYYRGRIDAIQLQYSDALSHMQQAFRRAPANGANGFKTVVTKWLVVIQLLMGDIPEKNVFRQVNNRGLLAPYFELTQAVREGVLTQFQQVLQKYKDSFIEDRLYIALLRLRRNVIKTGLRRINRSYSAISLEDVAAKLRLEGSEDAYYIVAKAIRDGVIEAVIDYENGTVRATNVPDVYSTQEPYTNFVDRTRFCLKVHTDAITSFRYPQDEEDNKKKEDVLSLEELDDLALEEMMEDEDEEM